MITGVVEKVAYENEALSKDLAFIILKGVNRVAYDDVDPYLFLMITLLSINDSLQQQRIEQVLGYPQLYFNRYDNYGLFEGLDEQYYSYESTLPWPDENISILNYIYQNKKKWEILCSVCLERTLKLADQNDNVLNYIASIPGPSYIFNSYLDWIRPFVNDFIEEAKRMNYPKYSQEKIEKGNEILKHYDSIEKKLASRHKIIESSKGTVISFTTDYEPLIIGKTVRETKQSEEILFKKRDDVISLSVIESVVYLMESKPNTFTNLAMPAVALDKNEFQNKTIHPDCAFFKMVNSFYWDDYRKKKLYERQETHTKSKDENPVDEDEETKGSVKIYPELGNNDDMKKKGGKLTIEIPEKKTENSKEKDEFSECISYEMMEIDKKDSKVKNYANFDLQIKEVSYIRRYVLRNDTLENIRLEIKFNENPHDINVLFPVSMAKKIHMRSTQVVVTLVKKKAMEDWPEKLNFETKLEFADQITIYENSSSMNMASQQQQYNTRVPYANVLPADDFIGPVREDAPSSGKKCPLCDVISEASAIKCSFCETPFEN